MCGRHRTSVSHIASNGSDPIIPPLFQCDQLNNSTFVITESDNYGQSPYIYVTPTESTIHILDTGVNTRGHGSDGTELYLRRFIETMDVADNGNMPLNPGGSKSYTIGYSHGHFDHIGGIPQFEGAPGLSVYTSGFDPAFTNTTEALRQASLAELFGLPTPEFDVTRWADDGERVRDAEGEPVGEMVILQTPGHTPDELAIWDPTERFLYVGDTLYRNEDILFLQHSNLEDYARTLGRLRKQVDAWNEASPAAGRVKLAAGHASKGEDAAELLLQTDRLLYDIVRGAAVGTVEEPENWAPGSVLVSYQLAEEGIHFIGPKAMFDGFVNGGSQAALELRRRFA